MARVASVSVTGTAEIVDEDDGDRARGREREHVWRLAGVLAMLLASADG
jgi:hypothetical protein